MRRIAVLLLAVLVLSACTKQPPSTAGPERPPSVLDTPATSISAPTEPSQPGGSVAGPESSSVEANLPVPSPLPEGMRRIDLDAGQSIEQPGLYYMDVATAKLEGWLLPPFDPQRPMDRIDTTPDHRWLTYASNGQGFLIRRSDGRAFRYDGELIWAIPGPGVFLLGPQSWSHDQASTFAIVTDEMKLLSTVSLLTRGKARFLFSPDGRTLAAALPGKAGLSLVDVATGKASFVAPLEADWAELSALPQLGEFVVRAGKQIKRFDWQGRPTGEIEVESWHVQLSPDGKFFAYAQSMDSLGQAIVVQEWGSETPLFRVAGAMGVNWIADSSALITSTRSGWQWVSTVGEMRPMDDVDRWRLAEWYKPSPDNPDLALTATRVTDHTGRTVQITVVKDQAQARVATAGWGPSGTEIHIVVTSPIGKDFDMEYSTNFRPRLQRPPFPENYPLEVQDPKGECLNLREEAAKTARIVRCLPTGTRLAMKLNPDGNPVVAWTQEGTWLTVETEAGESGWVAISTGSMTYAD